MRKLFIDGPLVLASIFFSFSLYANPELESISHGRAEFQHQGKEMVIHASDQAILNFKAFEIQRDETVRFQMRKDSHRVLNRIDSRCPSHIDGKLTSNGIVYLLNPAGVMFGPHSVVNVASLIVAAAHLSDADFLKGRDHFHSICGNVEVLGHLSGHEVVLIGSKVIQNGKVDAQAIFYVDRDHLYLGREGEHLFVKCDKDHIPEEGTFLASGSPESFLIYHGGISKAERIHLYGEKGSEVQITGTLDATSQEGIGGEILVQGEKIAIQGGHLDVSGPLGGGTILLGGGLGGKDLYPTARETACDKESVIAADALIQGDGGTIVQWADEKCITNGLYTVKGGPEGGDGGLIETSSGGGGEAITMRYDTTAPKGKGGAWKIDPYSIQLVDVGGCIGPPCLDLINDNTANSYTINTSVINAAAANSILIFAANNPTGHTPGTCSIALGTPTTSANINTTSANVTLVFNTTETLTVRGMMTTNGTINTSTMVFSTPVTLTGNTTLTASNAITFNFDVNGDGNGPWDLSTTANISVNCEGSIGPATPIRSLTVSTPSNAGTFIVGALTGSPPGTIHASGNISIGAVTKMLASTSFLSDTGGITFQNFITANTPTSQESLTLSAAGDIIFDNSVGLNPLGDILIQTANNVHLVVSPLPLSTGSPPTIQCRSFTQLNGTGDTLFEGSLFTTGVPILTRNPPQNGGPVFINTAGAINFYYLINSGGFPLPVLTYTFPPTRPYYKAIINSTGARQTGPGAGFNGGDVTLIGNSVNLLGLYAGGTSAFPGSSNVGGKGGDVLIETTEGLSLRGPIFATGGAGINGGGQVLPTLLFSGQDLDTTGADSPGNITITGPVTVGFNGVVVRGQNIQAGNINGANLDLLAIDGSTNGIAQLGSLSNLSYFVVDYSKGVNVSGFVQANGIDLFNSGVDGIVFQGPVTSSTIQSIANRFSITFAEGFTASDSTSFLNCQSGPTPPPVPPVIPPAILPPFAGVYAPSLTQVGDISFDTSTSLFSVLRLFAVEAPFADVFNIPSFFLNYLTPPQEVDSLKKGS